MLLVGKLVLEVAKFALIFEDLVVELINFLGKLTDLLLILRLGLATLGRSLLLLLLELSHELLFLSLEGLTTVVRELDLLFVQGLLFVKFTLRCHLTTLDFLLLIVRRLHLSLHLCELTLTILLAVEHLLLVL